MEQKAQEEEYLAAASTGEEAFNHAMSAAELYMKACSEAFKSTSDKDRLRRKFNQLADTAQNIKAAGRGPDYASASPSILSSTDNTALLAQGSAFSGSVFPPWRGDPKPGEFALFPGGDKYTDPTPFDLSRDQEEIFEGWRRPLDLFGSGDEIIDDAALMEHEGDCDLVQDLTADCSVVASLCALMNLIKPGHNSMLSSIMYPYDNRKGRPALSPNGKYIFRMYFNGCFRRVEIDDRLPSSKNDNTLYAVDRRKPTLIWPALLEKAYLKVRGGYDFPGSNSGTDLHVITSWIPEQLFLQSEEVDLFRSWGRVAAAYRLKDVIVTLGTGRIDESESRAFGLVSEHDYAVLDCRQTAGTWQLLVKNPWCDGTVWNRTVATATTAATATSTAPDTSATVSSNTSEQTNPGTFWIDLDDVAQNFESMYLNWNPSLFSDRKDIHFTWTPAPKVVALSVAYNRQFAVSTEADGPLWIILSRHFSDGEAEIARRKEEDSLASVSKRLGFMAIMVFETGGMRVDVTENYTHRGPFVDSPQTLARINAVAGHVYTVVPMFQDLPLPSYVLTISALSTSPLQVRDAERPMSNYVARIGSWTRRSAGGNPTSLQYPENPQYSLSVSRSTPLSILLTTESAKVAVRVDLVWARGGRVTVLETKDLVTYSGDYRRGHALLETHINAGTYTVVCSTFEPGQLGRFALRIGTRCPAIVTNVPTKTAGRLRTELPFLLFADGEGQKRIGLQASRLTRAMVALQSHDYDSLDSLGQGSGAPRPAAALRISVLYGGGRYPAGETTLVVSNGGRFRELNLGVETAEFDIEPDRLARENMWLNVEQAGSQRTHPGQGIHVEILSDYPVRAGSSWLPC